MGGAAVPGPSTGIESSLENRMDTGFLIFLFEKYRQKYRHFSKCPDQPRAMLSILRISASSVFSALVSSRSCARCPPCQALRDAVAFPSGVLGPVLCFHGCHCRISSACRCLRSNVQGVAMLVLQ